MKKFKIKLLKSLLILVFGFISLNVYSFSIDGPAQVSLKNCSPYQLTWTKHNGNTDRYDVIGLLNGTYDPDGDGVLEPATAVRVYYAEIQEASWWGALDRKYDFTIPKHWTGTLTFYIIARRRGGNWEEQTRTEPRTYTIASNVVNPPGTSSSYYCEGGKSRTITVSAQSGNTVNWYRDFTTPTPFHTGLSYTFLPNEGLTIFYVSQIANVNSCGFESVRVPITIYVLPGNVITSLRTSYAIEPEPDRRFGYSQCNAPGAYYDLSPAVPSVPDKILGNVNVTTVPFLGVSAEYAYSEWQDKNYYGDPHGKFRVCNTHLPSGVGTKRVYYKDALLKINTEIRNPANPNEILLKTQGTCNLPRLVETEVSKSRNCIAKFDEARLKIYANDVTNCTNYQDVTICPSTTSIIGPNDNLYNDTPTDKYSFQWTSSNGLTGINQKRPSISYDDISLPTGERYIKYTLTITKTTTIPVPTTVGTPIITTSTEYFCVYVYKCPDCAPNASRVIIEEGENPTETNDNKIQSNSDKIDTMSGKFNLTIYPNPASSSTILKLPSNLDEGVEVQIIDLTGRLLSTKVVKKGEMEVLFDLSSFSNGVYSIRTMSKGNIIGLNKLVINK